MAGRGRAPESAAALKLRGSTRAGSRKPTAAPEVAAPSCPSWIDADAKREWRRVLPEMVKLGMVSRLDRALLAGYAQSWADYALAVRKIAEEGELRADAKGNLTKGPWSVLRDQAFARIVKAAAVLGLSPESRSRVKVTPPASEENPKARFFKGL